MALLIEIGGGVFNTPKEFSQEIEILSPVYSEKGSQSVSTTFPGTENNLAMIGYIHRSDITKKPDQDVTATIIDGVYQRTGKLNVTSASRKGGIPANIGFDESLMYEKWADVLCKKIPGLPVYKPEGGIDEIIAHLNAVMRYEETADYLVFPILTSKEEADDTEYLEYINETKNISTSHVPKRELSTDSRTIRVVSSGTVTDITVPKGYGVSPFIRVGRLLELILEAYGYRLLENPFRDHYQLKKMVVLNNVADTITAGYIDYKDMMPDCTINDFLEALYCRTGARIFVNGERKTARVELLKDLFRKKPSADWTSLKAGALIPSFSLPKQLKLSAGTSFSGAETSDDSYEAFMDKYGRLIDVVSPGTPPGVLYTDKHLVFQPSSGRIYKMTEYYQAGELRKKYDLFSSSFFPWNKETENIAEEEISGPDECLPMDWVKMDDDTFLMPAFMAGVTYAHTIIKGTTKMDQKENKDTPLAFCFGLGLARNEAGISGDYYFGSSMCRDTLGNRWKDEQGNEYIYSLTFIGEDGAFNRFFKAYDAILRHANHLWEADLNLSRTELSIIDTSRPVSMEGQLFMIESLKTVHPLRKSKPSSAKFRSIKLLKPYDLESEQDLRPIGGKFLYEWRYGSNEDEKLQQMNAEILKKYRTSDIVSLRIHSIEYKENPRDYFLYIDPPTEEDVANNRMIKHEFLMNVWNKVQIRKVVPFLDLPIIVDIDVYMDVTFEAWVVAVKNPSF